MKREPTYVGIDVAKDRVDIAVRPTGQNWSASYEEEEVEKLVAKLQGLEPAAVILEATGGAPFAFGVCGFDALNGGPSSPHRFCLLSMGTVCL